MPAHPPLRHGRRKFSKVSALAYFVCKATTIGSTFENLCAAHPPLPSWKSPRCSGEARTRQGTRRSFCEIEQATDKSLQTCGARGRACVCACEGEGSEVCGYGCRRCRPRTVTHRFARVCKQPSVRSPEHARARIHARMHARTLARSHARTHARTHVHGCMHEHTCMYDTTPARTHPHEWMHACAYIRTYIHHTYIIHT